MNDTTASTSENGKKIIVSEAWKMKFDLLEKIGASEKFILKATNSAEFKSLSFNERFKVSFNLLALLFGPLYYFSKKIWMKGAVLFGAMCVLNALLTLIEVITGAAFPKIVYWAPCAVVFSNLANYDYYRYVKHGEKIWPGIPRFLSTPIGIIGFLSASLVLLIGIAMIPILQHSNSVPECSDSQTISIVKNIAEKEIPMMTYDVQAIRTKNINEKTGARECAAELKMKMEYNNKNVGNWSIPITYTVEKTDDKGKIYVTVYGIKMP